MAETKTQTAKVIQVLQWYDVPELVLLEGPKHQFTLAVRSAADDAGERTYVGGTMTARRLRDYANGKCDLRFAIAHANTRKFWKFDLQDLESEVQMLHIKRSDPELTQSIPDTGLFARDHTDIDVVAKYTPNTVERFEIDGSWDLGEFAQLYGQIEDIYYITSDIGRYSSADTSENEKATIREAFDRTWDGGGSYVAFYKKVANDNDYHAPLRVSGIQYNSPGHVKIFAQKDHFDSLIDVLRHFIAEETKSKSAYNRVLDVLRISGLNKKGASFQNLTPEGRELLENAATSLSSFLPSVDFAVLKSMTDGDSLVAAKVLLSIYRRVERLFRYFDEGRVAHRDIKLP